MKISKKELKRLIAEELTNTSSVLLEMPQMNMLDPASNNYEKDVYNGDVGFVDGIDQDEQTIVVRFDDRLDETACRTSASTDY